MNLIKIIFLAIFTLNFNSAFAQNNFLAKTFPQEIYQNFQNPKILGKHNLKILFLKIYDIKTFTEDNLSNKNYRKKFAIHIKYNRNFSKKELVQASIDEIKRIDKIDEKTSKKYLEFLNQIFADVKKNDEKTAFIDENGLQLFLNHKLIGEVKNHDFALSFADIWLSENAKYKEMRLDLLGLNY